MKDPTRCLPVLALLSLAGLAGLGACSHEGDENFGMAPAPESETQQRGLSERQLRDPLRLAQIAALLQNDREITRRLGSHRFSAHTAWQVRPPPPSRPEIEVNPALPTSPAALEEDVLIESDGKGLRIRHDNSHGNGTEARVLGDALYLRMAHQPYVRRRLSSDPEEVGRLLRAADNTGALLDLLAPYIEVGEISKATAFGRPVLKLSLGKRGEPLRRPAPAHPAPGRVWRQATQVDALSGAAVVDPEAGVLLGLRLSATFRAPRSGGDEAHPTPAGEVTVEVNHHASMDAVGQPFVVGPPEQEIEGAPSPQVIDPPLRPRPMQDYWQLLDGLVQKPHH